MSVRVVYDFIGSKGILAAAKGERLIAECRCVKNGKKLCYFQTEVYDDTGRQVALVTATGMHL